MTQVLNQVFGLAAFGASAITFIILCLSYRLGQWLMGVASRRGTFMGVIIVLIALLLSPVAVCVEVIRNHSLIRKTVLAIFIVTSITWGFATVVLMKSFVDRYQPTHSMMEYYNEK